MPYSSRCPSPLETESNTSIPPASPLGPIDLVRCDVTVQGHRYRSVVSAGGSHRWNNHGLLSVTLALKALPICPLINQSCQSP